MNLYFVAAMFLFILPCFFVLYITFADRLRMPSFSTALFAMLIFLGVDFISSYLYFNINFVSPFRSLFSILTMMSGVFILKAVIGYNFTQCIFIIAVIKCYADNANLFARSFYYIKTGNISPDIAPDYLLLYLIVILVTLPLICLFFKRLLRPAMDYTEQLPFWHFLWAIPLCINILFVLVIDPHFNTQEASAGNELYFTPYVWSVLCFLTYISISKMIVQMMENSNLQEQLHITDIQLSTQHKQVEALQSRIEETHRSRHDMRHHLLVLQGYASKKDYTELNRYLNNYLDTFSPVADENYCGDITINTILQYYINLAKQQHIHANVTVRLPGTSPFPAMDICIILGNLLENALEACMRQTQAPRFINVKMHMVSNNMLTIIIENSYEGIILKKGNSFLSSKKQGRTGIGLSSVQNIVNSYKGVLRLEYENQRFRVSVLINTVCTD